ncbi:MAG: PilZ domain-containing protein [Nitrospiraceae bacterium]
MVTSLREAVAAKLVQARAALEKLAPQLEADSPATEWQKESVRALEAVLTKLVQAWAAFEKLAPQLETDSPATEWQKGYVRALEEMLDLQSLTLRRYPRWQANVPTNIARMVPKQEASGQIVDLSVGGCRLIAPLELSVGAIIKVSFNHPEWSTIVTLHGLVCRTERIGEEYIAGVAFLGLPEDIGRALGVSVSAEDGASSDRRS